MPLERTQATEKKCGEAGYTSLVNLLEPPTATGSRPNARIAGCIMALQGVEGQGRRQGHTEVSAPDPLEREAFQPGFARGPAGKPVPQQEPAQAPATVFGVFLRK